MWRGEGYQITLIGAGLAVTALLAAFFSREINPEYKIYQNNYVALENFRSSYTHEPPPDFRMGIKQIVLEREDKGPATIDRCTSCHVALEIPYFSPTKLVPDANGKFIQVPNDEYIWDKLDQKIAELKVAGDPLATAYEALQTATVDGHTYDVKKALVMHPLIGAETRPFEFHPIEEYGCTSCHNGNGRGLTTDKAHGPVYDGQYEAEFMGPTPKFTESDPSHDPTFARVFNHKPGHKLLFQTEPIFVGALIQAKCMQCHRITNTIPPTEIDRLTENFQRGGELFITQACYACHRIAGLTRGGIGPELTRAGAYYPWFLKESIVWPQADVKDSTMPNMRLDHHEIENLMTFLLAQQGASRAVSEIDYRNSIQAWENGLKQKWEKPVSSSQIYDLTYSKTIFATEGCAACHNLRGFESNVGFTIEKSDPPLEKLHEEQEWFKGLFPQTTYAGRYNEMIPGSDIVKTIEANLSEIDNRISADVRHDSLLEQINLLYPRVIESFYSNFEYASRAKNDPQWRERVHKVLMTYIQVYGLGRLIGPNLNTSGVSRSDSWLMEHFRNPSSHVPRSIMPILPFDDTKFYALTNLLDHLGIQNRNEQRKIWELQGFNPAKAYELYCAQCHGLNLIGNGPVSEWIYPIPKNLRNSDFLQNLTKQKAIESITHGVGGTPMAPWGEVGGDKQKNMAEAMGDKPVLNQKEIELLVDWIYSSFATDSSNVLKWNYQPKDILKELQEEDLFENKPDPVMGEEHQQYYIKQKYYTSTNIEEGRQLFILNCAVCHGTEADGSGVRAQIMRDAKPRMLTNLDWINSHDDLRLLRSIKYGVPGTSMTPWGDITTPLQRIQLVTFIRSLSTEKEKKEALDQAIYATFDEALITIDKAGVPVQIKYDELEKKLTQLQEKLKKLDSGDKSENEKELVATYQEILTLEQTLKESAKEKSILEQLKALVKKEKELYLNLGVNIIMKASEEQILKDYTRMILLNAHRFKIEEGRLVWNQAPDQFSQIEVEQKAVSDEMLNEISHLKNELLIMQGKVSSAALKEELQAKEAEIHVYQKVVDGVKQTIDSTIDVAKRQKELLSKGEVLQ